MAKKGSSQGTNQTPKKKAPPPTTVGTAQQKQVTSPYASPIVDLKVSDGTVLHVPDSFLAKTEELRSAEPALSFRHLSPAAGHVLVHFLFSGTYQSPELRGNTPQAKLIAGLTTSVQIYSTAEKFKLPSLQRLAQAEITKLGDQLPVPLTLRIWNSTYPDPSPKDEWLCSYLHEKVMEALRSPSLGSTDQSTALCQTTTIGDMLLQTLLQLLQSNKVLLQGAIHQPAVTLRMPVLDNVGKAQLRDKHSSRTADTQSTDSEAQDDDWYLPPNDKVVGLPSDPALGTSRGCDQQVPEDAGWKKCKECKECSKFGGKGYFREE